MRKTFAFCTSLLFLTILSSANLAQEPLSEPPIILELASEIAIRDVDWNFDGTLIAFSDANQDVTIVNIDSTQIEAVGYAGKNVAWNRTKNYLLIANNVTVLWDYDAHTVVDDFEFPMAITEDYTPVGNVDWHPIQDSFAIVLFACDDGTNFRPGARIEIWEVETSTFTQIADCLWTIDKKIEWNPAGTQIAVSGSTIFDEEGFIVSDQIEVWDIDTAEKILTISDLDNPSGLTWSPSGDMIAFTTEIELYRYIQVWDVVNDELAWQIEADFGSFIPLDWHPSENFIVNGGQNGSVRIWNALNGAELIELPVHDDIVTDVSWSPDGTKLASVGRDGRLFVWDTSELMQQNK